jgi:hypothetical protein
VIDHTRELWLLKAADELRPWFEKAGAEVPKQIRVSVGFCKGRKAIGQCWPADASKDETHQIFICPTHESDIDMLDTLLHELVHAALPKGTAHRRPFAKLAEAVGLEPQPKWKNAGATVETKERLNAILKAIGPSSHGGLLIPERERKQTTRLRLYECECQPPIKLRVARDDLAAHCDMCEAAFICKTAA